MTVDEFYLIILFVWIGFCLLIVFMAVDEVFWKGLFFGWFFDFIIDRKKRRNDGNS